MRILVVGAGIAGLAAAAFLERKGHAVTVVERDQEWHLGFSIGVWRMGTDAQRALGIAPVGMPVREFVLADARGEVLTRYSLGDGMMLQMLRADLHEGLRRKIAGAIRMGVTVDVTPAGNATFSDGSTGVYDLIVAADGVHSRIRERHFPSACLRSIGWNGWYFWIDSRHVPYPGSAYEVWKPGGFFGAFPHGEGRTCAYIGMPAGKGDDAAAIRKAFASWPTLAPILAEMGDLLPAPVFEVHAPAWRNGKIILLGDAAHAMMPWAGMGAAMALEDAMVLAETLSTSVAESLARYEERRRPRVALAHRQTRLFWRVIRANAVTGAIWRRAIRHLPQEAFIRELSLLLPPSNNL